MITCCNGFAGGLASRLRRSMAGEAGLSSLLNRAAGWAPTNTKGASRRLEG